MDDSIENVRLQAILANLRRNPFLTRVELTKIIQAAEKTIQRDLETLKAAGKIVRIGGNRYGRWEIINMVGADQNS